MLAKEGCYYVKIKKGIPWNFITTKYTRYLDYEAIQWFKHRGTKLNAPTPNKICEKKKDSPCYVGMVERSLWWLEVQRLQERDNMNTTGHWA